jgi:hypothetical protein
MYGVVHQRKIYCVFVVSVMPGILYIMPPVTMDLDPKYCITSPISLFYFERL